MMLGKPIVTAFGATTILLLYLLAPLASPTHAELYHLYGPLRALLVPVLADFAILWLLLAGLLTVSRRRPWLNMLVWVGLGIALPWKLISSWYALQEQTAPTAWKLVYSLCVLAVAAAILASGSHRARLLLHGKRLGITLTGFSALSGVLMLAEILTFSFAARHLNDPRPLHTSASGTSTPAHPRILWILFDELSYRQVYEHRLPGLALPAFDRLAAESTMFTDARPAGHETQVVLPAYLTGHPVDSISPSASVDTLRLHDGASGTWRRLDPHDTVFADALARGYRTGLAGWFNPYCRLIPQVLDQCFWSNLNTLPGGMYPAQSMLSNAEQPFAQHLERLTGLLHRAAAAALPAATRFHLQDYRALLKAGDQLLRDPSINFVLLHLPIPHPQGIYNRAQHNFAVQRPTYFDNLALADVYLAHVRALLEAQGTWDDTTVVVMGDHSWRVDTIWARTPEWTASEQRATDGGRFDDRPAYLVKLPHQSEAARITTPFETVRTRALFDSLMAGQIETPGQLGQWARSAAQPRPDPGPEQQTQRAASNPRR